MAITENSFTAADLQAAVTANPALAAEIKTFGTSADYVIRTKDEDTTFMGNYERELVNKKTSEFANGIEADVAAIWGQPKKENEKYHDYVKRVITEAKSGMDSTKQELDALKANSTGTPADKDRIKQLEETLKTEKEAFNAEKAKLEGEVTSVKTGAELRTSLAGLQARYQKGIAKELTASFENQVVADVQKQTRFVDGKYVVVDAENKVIMNPTTYAPKTIAEILEERLAPILEAGQQGAGAGQQQQQQQQQNGDAQGLVKDAEGNITDVTARPAEVKTMVDLTTWMLKAGIVQGTPAFNKIYEKLSKGLELR